MNIVRWILSAYLVGILILMHASLLYCSQSHCIYPLESPPLSPQIGYQIRRTIASLLPYEMKAIQTWTQWIILGQIMLVILFLIRLASKIFMFAVWLGLACLITFAIVMYLSSEGFLKQTQQVLVDQKLFTHQQLGNWTTAGKEFYHKLFSYFE